MYTAAVLYNEDSKNNFIFFTLHVFVGKMFIGNFIAQKKNHHHNNNNKIIKQHNQ